MQTPNPSPIFLKIESGPLVWHGVVPVGNDGPEGSSSERAPNPCGGSPPPIDDAHSDPRLYRVGISPYRRWLQWESPPCVIITDTRDGRQRAVTHAMGQRLRGLA